MGGGEIENDKKAARRGTNGQNGNKAFYRM